jgi:hypothetical protein
MKSGGGGGWEAYFWSVSRPSSVYTVGGPWSNDRIISVSFSRVRHVISATNRRSMAGNCELSVSATTDDHWKRNGSKSRR